MTLYDLENLLDFDEDDAATGLDPLPGPGMDPISSEDFDEDVLAGLFDDRPVWRAAA